MSYFVGNVAFQPLITRVRLFFFFALDISPRLSSGTEGAADSVLWQRWDRRASRVSAPLAVPALRQQSRPAGLAGLAGDEHLEERFPAAGTQSRLDAG